MPICRSARLPAIEGNNESRKESHVQADQCPDVIAVDGNAIAGDLIEVLGVDFAATKCACASCGMTGFFAEAVVYMRGPGRVARCRACGEILVVLVTIHGVTCVDLSGVS